VNVSVREEGEDRKIPETSAFFMRLRKEASRSGGGKRKKRIPSFSSGKNGDFP